MKLFLNFYDFELYIIYEVMKKMKTIKDFILVEEAKIEERKSEGGIILSQDKTDYSKPTKGKVLSIGSKVTEVSVGDVVYFMPKIGVELDPKTIHHPKEGYTYRVIKEENVIGLD